MPLHLYIYLQKFNKGNQYIESIFSPVFCSMACRCLSNPSGGKGQEDIAAVRVDAFTESEGLPSVTIMQTTSMENIGEGI